MIISRTFFVFMIYQFVLERKKLILIKLYNPT